MRVASTHLAGLMLQGAHVPYWLGWPRRVRSAALWGAKSRPGGWRCTSSKGGMPMRRVALAIVSGLMIVALMAPAVLAARPATSFVAKASAAQPGGAIHLVAKAKHATRGTDFSATATVHFASGDVTVDLNRHGKSFVA